jgi:hypothetical protein
MFRIFVGPLGCSPADRKAHQHTFRSEVTMRRYVSVRRYDVQDNKVPTSTVFFEQAYPLPFSILRPKHCSFFEDVRRFREITIVIVV